jgi:hypothetical protein
MSEWIGHEFDAEAFDLAAINQRLARLAPPRKKQAAQKKSARQSAQTAQPAAR